MSGTDAPRGIHPRDALRCYRSTLEDSHLPMAATEGPAHVVRYANPAFCRFVGKERGELIGRAFSDVVPAAVSLRGGALLDHVYLTGHSETSDEGDAPGPRAIPFWSYTAWAVLDNLERPSGVLLQATDLTAAALLLAQFQANAEEMREMSQQLLLSSIRRDELAELAATTEHELMQARKMEGIGRVAGGIAHDFNNLLTVILGNAALAEDSLVQGADVLGYLREIGKAAESAATLTSQLLAFARKQVIHPKVTDLNALIRDIDSLLGRLVDASIRLEFRLGSPLSPVKVDAGQVGQVLMNLVVNARDALPRGGHVVIETSDVVLGERDVRGRMEAMPGRYVLLSVTDDGAGMDEATQARAFEPFFTTKEPGKGTGLGLATCYGIVKQAGGHVLLTSAPGAGTTVRILLPPAVTEGATLHAAHPAVRSPRGTERLLFVEDEYTVRQVAVIALRRQGYQVVEAGDGEEALTLVAASPPMDLIVTDVVMPRMGGLELVRRLREARPGVRILFTSGYAPEGIALHGDDAGLAFLPKPYTLDALVHRVRAVLDAPSPKADHPE